VTDRYEDYDMSTSVDEREFPDTPDNAYSPDESGAQPWAAAQAADQGAGVEGVSTGEGEGN
jgi:hypothetical protein